MRKTLLSVFIVLITIFSASSQVKVEKVEESRIPKRYFSGKITYTPEFPNKDESLDELYEGIQKVSDIEQSVNIGKNLVFNVNFDTIPGIPSDGKIYKEIEVRSPNSNTLSVTFSEIELSGGAEIFIINDEESYILGPITKENISKKENFDPGFIPGDKIRILFSENADSSEKSKVTISRIGHVIFDYFEVSKFQSSRTEGINCTGFGCSASCHLNILCNSGLTVESRAVALITYTDPLDPFQNISHQGTGYLVNNGAQNKRALFLAMIHGIAGYMVPDLKFIFHYQSPQCSPTTNGNKAYFINGATGLSLDAGNDLRLMELSANPGTSPIFSSNPVSYLGWSIIDETVSSINVIHHPLGDVKKYFTGGIATPVIEPGTSYGVWKYVPTNGFPETVSSGSPTLNSSKRVIGSLRSGSFAPNCSNYGSADIYSVRLSRSWAMLCQYLDPNNEGLVAINTYSGTTASKVFPSVLGTSQVCSSSTFTLNNAPIDLSVNWSIIQGSSLLSSPSSGTGKNALVSVLNSSVSGEVKIRFTISGLCTSKTYDKTFRVGKPLTAGAISGGTYTYTNSIISYSVPSVPGASSYNWQLPSGWTGGGSGLGNSITVTVGPSSGNVTVTPVNSCGQGQSSSLYVTVNNCPTCREINITPNPASESISIIPKNNNLDIDENFEILGYNIFDLNGRLLKSSDQKIIGSPRRIEVRDLPKGLYVIHLIFKEGVVAEKILVDR